MPDICLVPVSRRPIAGYWMPAFAGMTSGEFS
jgi:hypothetical protein